MKIAIHERKGSFSDRWIEYCNNNSIRYKIVNCYNSDIIEQLKDYDGLLWHHDPRILEDSLFAKQLLFSLEKRKIKIFPDFDTGWHFDDKVGQKYLLESINAPLVPSFIFYNQKNALQWAKKTSYPKVFKLRKGAGSSNVKLIKSYNQNKKVIKKAFKKGFSQFNKKDFLKERIREFKNGKANLIDVLKGFRILFIGSNIAKMQGNEKGYVYYQEFIPNNNFDIRIIVIGKKAFAIKRMVRENDFRASGSGEICYNPNEIDERCIKIAFKTNEKLKADSIAYDFVFDKNNNPLIIELSYGFDMKIYDECTGFWDKNLIWHPGKFNPQEWIIENLINLIKLEKVNNI